MRVRPSITSQRLSVLEGTQWNASSFAVPLRSRKPAGATGLRRRGADGERETHVEQSDLAVGLHHNVFRLDVPVDQATAVHRVEDLAELTQHGGRDGRALCPWVYDESVERHPPDQVHDDIAPIPVHTLAAAFRYSAYPG